MTNDEQEAPYRNERQVWFVGEHLAGAPLIASEHEPA